MESELLGFFEYVPYTVKNAKIYSPKLLALLMQICGYIDTIFKEMAKYGEFKGIKECQDIRKLESKNYKGYNITHAQEAFEKIYRLSSNNGATLKAKLRWFGEKEFTPFKNFARAKEISPDWWRSYNNVKHNWSGSLEQANMDNTLEALAGAFVLNAIHYPNIEVLWRDGVLKGLDLSLGGYVLCTIPDNEFSLVMQSALSEGKFEPIKPFSALDAIIIETPLFWIKYPR
jgi:hypothetical protein